MYCPSCGLEENHVNQFCRSCGADLRSARLVLEKSGAADQPAISSAREAIGRAVASKVRELDSARDLKKFAEDVLPEIEKFLESPAEKRLRRLRTGTVVSSIGFGVAVGVSLIAAAAGEKDMLFLLAGLGVITFFIGLGFVFNALFFTVPKKSLSDAPGDTVDAPRAIDAVSGDLSLPESERVFSSVTEQTTRHLQEKQSVSRD